MSNGNRAVVWHRSLLSLVFLLTLGCASAEPAAPDLERAERALAFGEAEDAADAFRSALAVHPECREALLGLARSYVAGGDGESALVVFSELERVDAAYFRERAAADQQFALYQAARSRLWRGDPAGALQARGRLRALDPDHPGLRDLMPRVLIAEGGRLQVVGRREEAEALLREATGEGSSEADLVVALAERLIGMGSTDTAITVLSDALLDHPNDGRLLALMDRALEIRYPDAP
jgi:thioredoxin-like negative regulator of GroEL